MLEKALKARLILEDGTTYNGRAFGYLKECVGEVVFTTGSAGYQETITNPSYTGKIVVWTNPLVGNYGFNLDDAESSGAKIKGIIVREKCTFPNNWRCEMDMDGYFRQNRIIGIEGIDTRALTMHIRKNGVMKGIIDVRGDLSSGQIKQKYDSLNEKHIVKEITAKKTYSIEGDLKDNIHVGILDLGVSNSLIKELKQRSKTITVFPAYTEASKIIESGICGLIISDGAGSPLDLPEIVDTIKEVAIEEVANKIPVFGVSLGCIMASLAVGCQTEKMKFGHHGCACPVKDIENNKVFITHQVHGYGISENDDIIKTFININDKTIEGFRHKTLPLSGVMFTPQTNTTSASTGFLYDSFFESVKGL